MFILVGMEVLYGEVPAAGPWRAMVVLSTEEAFGRTWQLGVSLARAHSGELLAVAFCPLKDEARIAEMRAVVDTAVALGADENLTIYPLIVHFKLFERDLTAFLKKAQVDLLLAHGDVDEWRNLNHVSCGVAVVRGDRPEVEGERAAAGNGLKHIIVPTSGGPNTLYVLDELHTLEPQIRVTAVYIAAEHKGQNEVALGQSRLQRLLDFIDGHGRIEAQVVIAESITEGIVKAAANADLVIIGASQESSLDKILFGNIPDTVVRESKRPIMIAREPHGRLSHWWNGMAWRLQKYVPRLSLADRTEAYTRIRRNARPDIDFFMLISLATVIAALGLLVNSPAVVIGAMLVAPLMSPIVGVGLAMILGDARFLRLSVGTVLKGTMLALAVGVLAGFLFVGRPDTHEMMARTQPSLIDLAIAWFSGLAAAYALCRSDAAGALPGVAIAAALVPPLASSGLYFARFDWQNAFGALLLFATNFVSISLATALMFLVLGFHPARDQKSHRSVRMRSAQVALISLAVVIGLILFSTYRLAETAQRQMFVEQTIRNQVALVTEGAGELDEINILEFGVDEAGNLIITMDITIKSERPILYQMVFDLQSHIGTDLRSEGILQEDDQVALTVEVIEVTSLDPRIPPTAAPTPTWTATPTSTPN